MKIQMSKGLKNLLLKNKRIYSICIEELKDEMCTIVHTSTGMGVGSRERWSTPEVKLVSGKKGRIRKDRYSALLIANMIARQIHRAVPMPEYEAIGGFVSQIDPNQRGPMYKGPEWFVEAMGDGGIFN